MSDVQISYLSLVDKAANKHEFLVTKNKDGKPGVKFSASILKSDAAVHEITGIIYEPLTADAHDNFMTADEIKKAADWFDKNGIGSDLQHNEQVIEGVSIVKSWVADEDTTINDKVVKAGTWLATAKIENDDVWGKIEKGEITGWSMGGVGSYSTTDVDIASVEKSIGQKIVGAIAKAFGFTYDGTEISDTNFTDEFDKKNKSSQFWNAWNTLQDFLVPYDDEYSWSTHFQDNKETITSALQEFSTAIQDVLGASDVAKALEPPKSVIAKALGKAGKKMSTENFTKLDSICKQLSELKDSFSQSGEGDENMKAEDIQKAVGAALTEALDPIKKEIETLKNGTVEKKADETVETKPAEVTKSDDVAAIVKAAVSEAITPLQQDIDVLKAAKGISKQAGDGTEDVHEEGKVTKSVFAGIFNVKGGIQ